MHCLPPTLTITSLRAYSRLLSRLNLSMIAFFNDGMPETGVYLVKPLSIAFFAASLICCGVSKSGSPAARPIMSLPSDL